MELPTRGASKAIEEVAVATATSRKFPAERRRFLLAGLISAARKATMCATSLEPTADAPDAKPPPGCCTKYVVAASVAFFLRFAALGAVMPYIFLWLEDNGFDVQTRGLVLCLVQLCTAWAMHLGWLLPRRPLAGTSSTCRWLPFCMCQRPSEGPLLVHDGADLTPHAQ